MAMWVADTIFRRIVEGVVLTIREAFDPSDGRSSFMRAGDWMEIELAGDSIAAKIVLAEEWTVTIELADGQRWTMTPWKQGDFPHRPWVGDQSDDWTIRGTV